MFETVAVFGIARSKNISSVNAKSGKTGTMLELPTATIVITTRNRREELRRALRSAVRQEPACEVLVIDDGSTDGTAEAVRTEFPSVRLERREETLGLIVRRNEGARFARGAVIISIDDDAEFSDPHTVAATLVEFDDPQIGAVAMPFVNVLQSPAVHQRAPGSGCFVTDAFIGTAHALKRELFSRLGGYREDLIHQGEERDFCLRMLAIGKVVRLGRAEPIMHHESPRRDWSRQDFYGWRNNVIFAWRNVPITRLTWAAIAVIFSAARHAAMLPRSPKAMLRGISHGIFACLTCKVERAPVTSRCYEIHRRLVKRSPLPLTDLNSAIVATDLHQCT